MTAEERQALFILYLYSGDIVSYDTHCRHKGFRVGGGWGSRRACPKETIGQVTFSIVSHRSL